MKPILRLPRSTTALTAVYNDLKSGALAKSTHADLESFLTKYNAPRAKRAVFPRSADEASVAVVKKKKKDGTESAVVSSSSSSSSSASSSVSSPTSSSSSDTESSEDDDAENGERDPGSPVVTRSARHPSHKRKL
jgi:cobalamin biosynthesis Mg chelatase CobN